jgi:L-ribulose-5-phosphate 4-epimerase
VRFEELRTEIADLGRRLQDEGLFSLTAGNLSGKAASGLIAITPSAIPYPEIGATDVVIVDVDGHVVDGDRRPSSELPMHLALYEARPEVGAVVHTHSPYATTLAVLGKTIPAVHYMIAGLGVNEIPLVPYSTYGTADLASHCRDAIGAHAKAALLANHGAIALGADLSAAATAASVLEFLALLYYRALAVGQPVVLPPDEIGVVQRRYRTHGQPRIKAEEEEA